LKTSNVVEERATAPSYSDIGTCQGPTRRSWELSDGSVHLWGWNADIGCGAKTLGCTSVLSLERSRVSGRRR
jgi:hypothetical protein